ncbi:MAG: hypothetical protein A2Z06_01310 [Candidatus Glassbacteria bacterium RBG_16_58_8]|uniref:Helix-turn-helix domain-containing protein n=1 Tax=Candidatus Glassbacteria bacterium RBG_16_58_8 TaxID=1817866 RepID=A0A1F5YBY9_9BACT|nr:MAG: hypothetical protein A2Z06_01310 [Candidatus Glassbacteria bacterium RBG_16_58_8]
MKVIKGIKVYEVEDLSKILGLTEVAIRRYIRAGRIPGQKIGKRWYVSDENLKAFINPKPVREAK